MERKNDLKIEITELFMAKAGRKGWERCFHGTIKRDFDSDGNPVVYGKIKVKDGYIYATASDQWELGEKLDEIVLLILDYDLHKTASKNAGNPVTGLDLS